MSEYTRQQKIDVAWKQGTLHYKLKGKHKHQRPIYDAIRSASFQDYFVLLCARRTGKSFVALLVAIEDCIRHPNITIGYIGPEKAQAAAIVEHNIREILLDCPNHLKPKHNIQKQSYNFPNGSKIVLAGSNNKEEDSLRGSSLFKALVDEARDFNRLNYILNDVLAPATNTDKGQIIIMSTPADTAAHEFFDVAEAAKERGSFVKFTINDCNHFDDEQLAAAIAKTGGIESDTYRREYLCEWVTSTELKIIGEWADSYIGVLEPSNEYYQFYDHYIGMDLGFKKDFTSILAATYNFHEATLYVEDEYTNKGIDTVTRKLSIIIKQMETKWPKPAYRRIADNNEPRVLADLNTEYELSFIETTKESLKAMVNQVRDWVKDGRIKVAPHCFQLLGCLNYGVWNTTMKEFDRSNVYGHFDALAALIYLVRNINESKNPIPKLYKAEPHRMHIPVHYLNNIDPNTQKNAEALMPQLFKRLNRHKNYK